ncbi:SUMF1/EgtB/PvdO family nonheme iron enzyme [Pseudenhygromyxa sp. WMMC2535]|uniref:formylglycine-generating enzyme family protein n=1 Tax=Pseudenhygromyxa sp. WMMC2535 TaxID=2712867 RepID=UPI001553538C|nr:SUMF1/EgtB/PvdO family nonheme iron enzyme [Pseudenhygromyxa sp. WMMC2535]NVB38002.1 SUMF1/EgtB/PvdO family nonheme iron enzyme [Pseudenhygromyxa sp. WMMC2535]
MRTSSTAISSCPWLLGLLVASGLSPLGCDRPDEAARTERYFDQPPTIPAGEPYRGKQVPDEAPKEVSQPDECPRSGGINPEGQCVTLVSHPFEDGQNGEVQIPGGVFWRGDLPPMTRMKATPDRPYVKWAGQPLFEDRIDSYWIDGWEVNRLAYGKCVSAGECTPARCLDGSDGRPSETQLQDRELASIPQTCVTHDQAAAYCEWRGARLPTEAQWEYAARGPLGWTYPWGNQFRDELGLALGPVGFDPLDISYFGLKGFGGNATEWVADPFDPDAYINRYVTGEFRDEDGPLARSWADWIETLCGGSECELGQRYTVKGGRSGARAGAWQLAEGASFAEPIPEQNFETDRMLAQHPRLGFRCARDLGDQTPLTVPQAANPLPIVLDREQYQIFMAVAEAVSRDEAVRFCSLLRAPGEGDDAPAWRLPSIAEVRALYMWFGGPGPFWTREGAAEQTYVDKETAEWASVEIDDDQGLLARCIRDK